MRTKQPFALLESMTAHSTNLSSVLMFFDDGRGGGQSMHSLRLKDVHPIGRGPFDPPQIIPQVEIWASLIDRSNCSSLGIIN